MRAVNLLPREATKQRTTPFGISQQNLPAVVGLVLGIIVITVLAIGFTRASGKVSDAKARLREVQTQLANTPQPPAPKPIPNAQLAGEKSARVTAVSVAIGSRLSIDRVLRELSLVLPDDITLSNVTVGQATGTGTASLSLAGYTYSHDSVARLLSRLALVPDLSSVELGGSSSAGGETGATTGTTAGGTSGPVSFTITADVKLPPGAAAAAAPAPVVAPPPSTDTTMTGASS